MPDTPKFMLRRVQTAKADASFLGCILDPLAAPLRTPKADEASIIDGMYFLAAAGSQNQLQSIWATVNASLKTRRGAWVAEVTPAGNEYIMAMPRRRFAARIGTPFQMNLVTDQPGFIYQINPAALKCHTDEERTALIQQGDAAFAAKLVEAILLTSPINIHNSWAATIFQDLQQFCFDPQKPKQPWAYRPLNCYGSALRAWRLNTGFDWINYIQTHVRSGRLPWPS